MRLSLTQPVSQATHKPLLGRRLQTTLVFWLFAGPLVVGLLVFTYLPILIGFRLSFFSAVYTVTPQTFVGWRNYLDLLKDAVFLRSIGFAFLLAILLIPLSFFSALGLALLVNRLPLFQGFFRSVFYLPSACSAVAASIIWKSSLFSGYFYGFANMVLGWFHAAPISWMGAHPFPWYWIPILSLYLWLGSGFTMIIFLASLQSIPRELYEAAAVDGARTGWQTFRFITFPLLSNTSVFVLTLSIIGSIQAFDIFYNIFSYGQNATVQPPLVYLYSIAFAGQDFGHGAAGSFIIFAIIIVLTLIQGRLTGYGRVLS